MVTPADATPRRLRIPIRYKLLLAITVVLLLAVGAYVWLATSLFTRDKLAYIYDLNASLVQGLSEQARSEVAVIGQTLSLFSRDVGSKEVPQARKRAIATELFRVVPELVRVQLYRRGPNGFEQVGSFTNPGQLAALSLGERDLELSRRRSPLPFEAIAARPGEPYVENVSLPPDAALLEVAVAPASASGLVVAAEVHPERLLRLFGSSPLHETLLLDERGTVLASADPQEVIRRASMSGHPLVRRAAEAKPDREVREYDGPQGRMLGGFGRVEGTRLLVLTEIPRAEALRTTRELVDRSLYFAVAVLLGGILVSIVLSRLVTSPIRRLRAATEVVGEGRFDVAVDLRPRDEIGDLARSFVQMAHALRRAQAQLVRSEKLAAFGQLGAGITHELKNPLTGIVGFAQIAQRKLDHREKLTELLRLIEAEGLRCKDILVNFLKFARHQSGRDAAPVSVNELVQSSAKIFGHQLSMNGVTVKLELDESGPSVMVNSGELQQVLLNLAMNAQQAMSDGGEVRVTTRGDGAFAEISIADTGPGIPEELRERIFEPFFTTKPAGEGTGLGLAISYGIVRDHGGTLSLGSEPGGGAVFVIRLPVAPAGLVSGPSATEPAQERLAHG
jgi:signal transduction histidine kinase